MKQHILHITNGDSFTERLGTLPIEGDVITWREMLCEGKTLTHVGSESFWKTRFEFLNKRYKVSKSWFVEKTLKEYRSLCNYKQHNIVVLWFEYDLFCQINMLAVISWLKTHRRYSDIFLINSGKIKGEEKLFGLNELTDEQLLQHFENKVHLTQDDIEYADYIWQLYCSDNPIRLENLSDYEQFQFNYLGDAIKAHLKRFPTIRNGLNDNENTVLRLARENKLSGKRELIRSLLQDHNAYGFGDVQYQVIIQSLKPLFSSFNPIRLSKTGIDVAEGHTNFYSQMKDDSLYLGGALKYNFLYNNQSERILKL